MKKCVLYFFTCEFNVVWCSSQGMQVWVLKQVGVIYSYDDAVYYSSTLWDFILSLLTSHHNSSFTFFEALVGYNLVDSSSIRGLMEHKVMVCHDYIIALYYFSYFSSLLFLLSVLSSKTKNILPFLSRLWKKPPWTHWPRQSIWKIWCVAQWSPNFWSHGPV